MALWRFLLFPVPHLKVCRCNELGIPARSPVSPESQTGFCLSRSQTLTGQKSLCFYLHDPAVGFCRCR